MSIKSYSILTKKYKAVVSAIHSMYRLVISTFNLHDLIMRLSKTLCQIFNAQYCMIMLVDPTRQYSVLKCVVKKKKITVSEKKLPILNKIEMNIVKSATSLRHNHGLYIPLIAEDVIGLIYISREKKEKPFDVYDQEIMMTLMEPMVIGIRNLQLYKEQEKIIMGSIKSLVTLLDIRVPQEYTHSPYFSRLVSAIAHQMQIDDRSVQSLQYASMLHDAGKADIPMEILTKTTKLTARERMIIKHHPVKGVEMLRHLQILKPAIPIIMHHHEKFNGTGYPSRLKGKQIPLGSRIMAVADAFEAMVYGRPYRERMTIENALNEIKNKSGTQFDPVVVEAFLKIAKKLNLKKYLKYNVK
ncbi:MAG: HD domain-containing protein [Candidatus Omnitrophica bacterium]|nr:HD domain-containing protein [Candidatus Omnitrophota bacterium]